MIRYVTLGVRQRIIPLSIVFMCIPIYAPGGQFLEAILSSYLNVFCNNLKKKIN